MKLQPGKIVLSLLACMLLAATPSAAQWPDWRGPDRDGRSPETGLPESWSPDGDNLAWKAPYGGRSTPVIHGDRVYLQNGSGEGADLQERVICFNAHTGELIWEYKFNIFLSDVPTHRVGWASPVVDTLTGNIYVNGVGGTLHALSPDGNLLWTRSLNEDFSLITTHGGRTVSPVIESGLVIVSGPATTWGRLARPGQKFFAFFTSSGDTAWVSPPPGRPYDTVYSPPIITEVNGTRLLIAGGSDGAIHAIKPLTGEHVWRFGMSKRGINTGAVIIGGDVFVSHGEENLSGSAMGMIAGFALDSKGEIPLEDAKWTRNTFLAGYSSAVTDGIRIYQIDNSANLAAIDPATGDEIWRENIGTIQRASPVLADGKLYVGSQNGRFFILRPGADGVEILDQDKLGGGDDGEGIEEIVASVAVAHGRIYLVSMDNLYAIGPKETQPSRVMTPVHPFTPWTDPVSMLVNPTELALKPGEKAHFNAMLYDEKGNLVGTAGAEWSLKNLTGEIDSRGTFTVPGDSGPQAGEVVATIGNLTAAARLRVLPPPPVEDDFESYPAGGPGPTYWNNAGPVKYELREVDHNKVLVKRADNQFSFVRRVRTHMGDSSWSDYTMEIDVLGKRVRRRMGDAGIIVQRYMLYVLANTQRLVLNPWQPETDRAVIVPLPWEPDVWYRMKLRVENLANGAVRVRGKVWRRDDPEPAEWNIDHTDTAGNRQGSPGIYADAYSEIFFDNLKITPNE